MSEAEYVTTAAADPQAVPGQGQGQQALPGVAQTVTVHPVVQSVVQAVQATTPPSNWATTAAQVLLGLSNLEQPILTVSRASPRTSAEVQLGVAIFATFLQAFFPHPAA